MEISHIQLLHSGGGGGFDNNLIIIHMIINIQENIIQNNLLTFCVDDC